MSVRVQELEHPGSNSHSHDISWVALGCQSVSPTVPQWTNEGKKEGRNNAHHPELLGVRVV